MHDLSRLRSLNSWSELEASHNAVQFPGAKRGDDGSRSSKVEVLSMQVAFSSTGREWATEDIFRVRIRSREACPAR